MASEVFECFLRSLYNFNMKYAINRMLGRDFIEDVHKSFIDQAVVKNKLICIGREQQDGGTKGAVGS